MAPSLKRLSTKAIYLLIVSICSEEFFRTTADIARTFWSAGVADFSEDKIVPMEAAP